MQDLQNSLERGNTASHHQEGPTASTPLKVLTTTSIIGSPIVHAQGDTLGTIKDLMLNLHEGSIAYVVIQSGGFLGIGSKLFAIPFKNLRIHPDQKSFLLDSPLDNIIAAPGFDPNHWPETNAHYDVINSYWDVDNDPDLRKQNPQGRLEIMDIL